MDAAQHRNLEEAPVEESRGTLGEVIYGGRAKPAASEADWVALVQSIAAGDQLALHALYERTYRVVFTLAMRISGNRETAEEVTLDVFHGVWQRASRYDVADGTVLGWIMNQARSRAIDRLRFDTRKKRVESGTDDLPQTPEQGNCLDAVELKEKSKALQCALAALSSDERQAIEVAYFSELTYAEAATRLNQPLGTVKTRIRSGLRKLRQALSEGVDPP